MNPPVALTIAGSDSGGGAGVQADLRSFAALRVFGTSAITALTAQNTAEVRAAMPVGAEMVVAQVEAVLDDLPVAAVKTGMLAEEDIVEAVTALALAGRLPNLVVDPVMVASSGAKLATPGAVAAYRRLLLPAAAVVTPNLMEAEALLGVDIASLADQRAAACRLGESTGAVIVVKGGHGVADSGDDVVDVVWQAGECHEMRRPRVLTANTHGSGCSFSAAITAGLASGAGVLEAIAGAGVWVQRAIEAGASWRLGSGPGPLDHFAWSATPPGGAQRIASASAPPRQARPRTIHVT